MTAGYNESDVVELARLTVERDWHVRFIELMPLGGGECATLSMKRYVSNIETRRRIESALGPLTEIPSENLADESRNYRLAGARGVVGFISPVSEPYCGTCNRMRLTADGKFHLCLLNDDELDVRKALRSNSSDPLAESRESCYAPSSRSPPATTCSKAAQPKTARCTKSAASSACGGSKSAGAVINTADLHDLTRVSSKPAKSLAL